jgi:DNA-binding response OmpR family regulator
LLRFELLEHGYEVHRAVEAGVALRAARPGDYDLYIVACCLAQGGDGVELCR